MSRMNTDRPDLKHLPQAARDCRQRAAGLRAVLLVSGDVPDMGNQAIGVQCVRAESSYEAAAEMLIEATSVLVVDGRLVTERHLGLLDLARRVGTETFAIGPIPSGMTCEELSGMRLLSRSALPAALAALSGQRAKSRDVPAEQVAQQCPRSEDQPSVEQLGSKVAGDLLPDGVDAPITAAPEPTDAWPDGHQDDESTDDTPAGRGPSPGDILSAEELSALLEDDP